MGKRKRRWLVIAGAGLLLILLVAFLPTSWLRWGYHRSVGRFFRHSVESRLAQISDVVAERLQLNAFPEKLDILALKNERIVEVWGQDKSNRHFLIAIYPILAASGTAGPKLREGDLQVPEGIYQIESLHPNSNFYLALKIGYPSDDDVAAARAEQRDIAKLGSAIMLHGKGGSVGCIAIANQDIEDIFYLTARTGVANTRILICPYDFRKTPPPQNVEIAWLGTRYRELDEAIQVLQ